MYAIEFEADIKGEYLRIPQFEKLKNQHVKVILLADEPVANELASSIQPRKPAKVPPIRFQGDILTAATEQDWFAS